MVLISSEKKNLSEQGRSMEILKIVQKIMRTSIVIMVFNLGKIKAKGFWSFVFL